MGKCAPVLKGCLKASKIRNIDGKILGKDGNPLRPIRSNFNKGNSFLHVDLNTEQQDDGLYQDANFTNCSQQENPNHVSFKENPNSNLAGKGSFTEVVNSEKPSKKSKFKILINSEHVENADFVLLLATLTAAQQRYTNSLVGYFAGKNVAFPLVQNYVTNTWGKFGFQKVIKDEDGFFYFKFSSLTGLEQVLEQGPWLIRNIPIIPTKWSLNLSLEKDKVTKILVWVKMHKVPVVAYSEDGLSLIATQVGKPVMLDACTSTMCSDPWGRIGYARALIEVSTKKELKKRHNVDLCPKCVVEIAKVNVEDKDDGFTTVTNRKKKAKQPQAKKIKGVKINKPKATFVENDIGETSRANLKDQVNKDLNNDSESEIEVIVVESVNNPKGASTPSSDGPNDWTSNANIFSKGCCNILGWNLDVVNVVVVSQTSQVMHVKIIHKVLGKQLFCSFIYASSNPVTRRILWADLEMHKLVTRGFPWTLIGDFNVALNLEDYSSGSSNLDSAISDFKDCVYNIEVLDINSSGLHFTWNQKPKGSGGLLKKLDRIMGNTDFIDAFLGSYALFQPYRVSDHSPTFLELVSNVWNQHVDGHRMYQVVSKLKALKKPFQKLMNDQGNLHERVCNLRVELDEIQKALDVNPNDSVLRDEEAVYLQAFSEAKLDEERFLKQKAKIKWLDVDSADSCTNMVRPVSDEEIKVAMFSIGDDRAPGSDGYSSAFFKKGWDIVGGDVPTPLKVNDYWPISCCNVIYKCISKILTNRIINGIKEVVSENQYAFVPGRSISDNILITQELMHNYYRNRGPPRCAFKIDIQKAYDTVDWRFLDCALKCFGFHPFMIKWIMAWVTSTSFSLRLNGDIHGFFKGKRDDLFIFARRDLDSARVIMESLEEFKATLGLIPSLPKSTSFFCNVSNHVKLAILNIMPFAEGTLPVKYLGVPLISSRFFNKDCKILVDKVKNRIGDWKNKSLSFAGRLQLYKSVLSSMHVYWASVLIIPKGIIYDIQSLIRGFLWCNGEYKRGMAKVACEDICLPKHEVGLGLRNLDLFNMALMTKHIWNIVSNKESL
ncbi:hypothetical protein Tco_0486714 [Tanacetum coccineum]